jgi:hypothetical protein
MGSSPDNAVMTARGHEACTPDYYNIIKSMMRSILRGARTMRARRPGELLKVAVAVRGEREREQGDSTVYSNILLAAHNKTQTDKNLSGSAASP